MNAVTLTAEDNVVLNQLGARTGALMLIRLAAFNTADCLAAPKSGKAKEVSGFTDHARREMARERAAAMEQTKRDASLQKIKGELLVRLNEGRDVTKFPNELNAESLHKAYLISIEERYERGSSSWRSGPFIGWKIVIGGYGDKSSFPQKKNDSFSWDKIALEFWGRIARKMAEQNTRQKIEVASLAGKPIAEEIRKEFELSEYGGTTVNANVNKVGTVQLQVSLNIQLTPERAREILTALKAVGVKLKY